MEPFSLLFARLSAASELVQLLNYVNPEGGSQVRIYAVLAPQNMPRPYLVYQLISRVPDGSAACALPDVARVQVSLFADSYAETCALAALVRQQLHYYETAGAYLEMVNEFDHPSPAEALCFFRSQDYRVELAATAAAPVPPPPPTVHPYVVAWAAAVEAAGGTVPAPTQAALSTLYTTLVARGWLAKLQRLYLFVPGAVACTFDFLDSSRRFELRAGLTSTAAGLVNDGTGYIDTGFIPALHATSADDQAYDTYEVSTTTNPAGSHSFGVSDYGNTGQHHTALLRNPVHEGHTDANAYLSSDSTDSAAQVGYLLTAETLATVQRSAGGVLSLYQYGRKVDERQVPAVGLTQQFSVYVGAKNNFGGPDKHMTGTHKHFVIRQALPDDEVEAFTLALQRYHIGSGRDGRVRVFTGDSISKSLGSEDSWCRLLCQATGHTLYNWSVSSQQGLEFVTNLAAQQLPAYDPAVHDRLYNTHATNDELAGRSAADYANLVVKPFVQLAIARGWPAASIVISPSFYQRGDSGGAIRQAYVAAVQALQPSLGFTLLNFYALMKATPDPDATFFPNGDVVHPPQAGQQALALLAEQV